jgi:hypothetical protein
VLTLFFTPVKRLSRGRAKKNERKFVRRFLSVLLFGFLSFGQCLAEDSGLSEEAQFFGRLERDVKAHLGCEHVTIEMLRRRPTQVGVALPKYYLWVIANTQGKVTSQGAMRVADADGQKFDVIQYLTVEQIENNPGRVGQVFPKALVPKIMERAGEARRT